ncbi:hypothetical protein CEK62_09310 [Alcanivorax sp. N3-2A]|nr:hypothetical protein CEK62_09310 [Alcanivorax sp. N3-2A]
MLPPRPTPYRRAGQEPDLKSETLPQAIAPVWGAFLFEGLMTSPRNANRGKHVLTLWKASRIRLITESCYYLDRIWAYSRRQWRSAWPSDGVFEYEVVSAFGELLGYHLILNNGQLPPDEEADLVIRDLVDTFFQHDDEKKGPPKHH